MRFLCWESVKVCPGLVGAVVRSAVEKSTQNDKLLAAEIGRELSGTRDLGAILELHWIVCFTRKITFTDLL